MKRVAGKRNFSTGTSKKNSAGYDPSQIAYVPQTAWLRNATIRDNIIFNEPFERSRYEKVLHDCALIKDLSTFEGGDLTEVGPNGVNLSGTANNIGGQKQRISLARACYSRAAYVLLDDPLSAVDAPTARHLLDNAILGSFKNRTCILVSHYVNLVLPYCDYYVVFNGGQVVSQRTREQAEKDPNVKEYLGQDVDLKAPKQVVSDKDKASQKLDDVDIASVIKTEGTLLITAEDKATGSVSIEVYKKYVLAAGGLGFLVAFLVVFFAASSTIVFYDVWLKHWTDSNSQYEASKNFVSHSYARGDMHEGIQALFYQTKATILSVVSYTKTDSDTDINPHTLFYITVYALVGLLTMVLQNTKDIIIFCGSFLASKRLHKSLLKSVLYSPLRFFETTPAGRILNRFSKDIDTVDSGMMDFIEYFVDKILNGITIIVVIAYAAPLFLVFVVPIIYIYTSIAKRYLTTSRDLKRLESITRSPVYSQFSETLSGVATIRAFKAEEQFIEKIKHKVDENHKFFFFMWACNRWLCWRIDMISSAVVLFAGILVVLSTNDAGLAALTLTYALQFTQALLWIVRIHAEMEMNMNSMERIKEYIELEQEPPEHILGVCTPDWPTRGRIVVEDLCIRYAFDQPDVLKNVSFSIKPHEKVAIVGRTGAGKSTLSLAFFRILEFSGGRILIDGVDIGNVGLYDLRSRLTIIPQDPVLFEGTLRSNLDPFQEHSDMDLWDALKRVHMPGSLDDRVSENGGNFSQGQRQLLSLARALLRRNKIILLDEATASVDTDTDKKIQETIRQEFKHTTVICIAHRLQTVIDYDRILVLDKGRVVEYGTPADLLQSGGMFSEMAKDAGI